MYLKQWKWNRKDRNKLYQSIEELMKKIEKEELREKI